MIEELLEDVPDGGSSIVSTVSSDTVSAAAGPVKAVWVVAAVVVYSLYCLPPLALAVASALSMKMSQLSVLSRHCDDSPLSATVEGTPAIVAKMSNCLAAKGLIVEPM
eukprot:5242878-Amphidinium_carterae.3